MPFDFVEAIRLVAMQAVAECSPEYQLRSVMRWWSREFHTPLAEVYEIPLENILLDYYECKYEEMDDSQRHYEIGELLKTKEQITKAKVAEDKAEVEDEAYLRKVMEEAKKVPIEEPKKVEPPPPELPEISMDFSEQQSFEEALEQDAMAPPPKKKR